MKTENGRRIFFTRFLSIFIVALIAAPQSAYALRPVSAGMEESQVYQELLTLFSVPSAGLEENLRRVVAEERTKVSLKQVGWAYLESRQLTSLGQGGRRGLLIRNDRRKIPLASAGIFASAGLDHEGLRALLEEQNGSWTEVENADSPASFLELVSEYIS
ncbi:MAG: hypothetical protein HY594_04420 [Candidatus Omnitrophica bacterium]|nr:hypothetical protein [Candidatus Omnitrophota bacterium]